MDDLFSMAADWYAPLRNIVSLGAQDKGVAHQGELHEARQRHLGQFFTPDAIAAFMWQFVCAFATERRVSVLDNSVGSARLLQFADPARHTLFGVDVHGEVVESVQAAVEAAGFDCTFRQAGMEAIDPQSFDVALINPPFSVHLESPHLQAFPCTTWGRYGPNSSALSHEYAVHQALEAAGIVVALLPLTTAEVIAGALYDNASPFCGAARRLAGFFDMPADAFKAEGANVRTAVLVFDRYRNKPSDRVRVVVDDLSAPVVDLGLHFEQHAYGKPRLNLQTLDDSSPVITRPVTGDKTVKICHDGRRIKLRFRCGFTEAMVLNYVLDHRIFSRDGHRLPRGMRYAVCGAGVAGSGNLSGAGQAPRSVEYAAWSR
jgi:hypothetical protein